jgi:hypothetical protein
MQRYTICLIVRFRAWCMAAALLITSATALAQQSGSPWTLDRTPSGAIELSARSEIAAPQGAGFAILKIIRRTSGDPKVIVYLIVESPKRIPTFPFDKYDGPVDKTSKEFITFEVAPGYHEALSGVKVMPNGYYAVTPPDAFVFDTIDKRVLPFLLAMKDGQKLSVMVNGPPSSIRVVFDTTGLKQVLGQMGLEVAPRRNTVPQTSVSPAGKN